MSTALAKGIKSHEPAVKQAGIILVSQAGGMCLSLSTEHLKEKSLKHSMASNCPSDHFTWLIIIHCFSLLPLFRSFSTYLARFIDWTSMRFSLPYSALKEGGRGKNPLEIICILPYNTSFRDPSEKSFTSEEIANILESAARRFS